MASLLFRLVRASMNLSKQIRYPARKPRRNLPAVLGGDFIKRPVLELNCPRYIISTICEFAVSIGLLWTLWCYFTYDSPRVFSARLTPAIPRNGSVGAPAATASTRHRAALDVVLHASNRRATGSCYHHGEGAVTYGGYTVASGRAPDFCMPSNGAREVPFRLAWDWDDGSGLPESLRGRIAAAEKVGAVEFEVQVRLLRGGDARSGTGTPTWMWCKARMGGAVTPCTVFAPQNWFSPLA